MSRKYGICKRRHSKLSARKIVDLQIAFIAKILPPMRPGNVRQHRHYKQPHHRRLFRSLIARAFPLSSYYIYIHIETSQSVSLYLDISYLPWRLPRDWAIDDCWNWRKSICIYQISSDYVDYRTSREMSHRHIHPTSGSLALSYT